MLKLRVLTALLLAPLAIWATLVLPNVWFAVILGIIFSLGAWEWSRLAGLRQTAARAAYVALFVLLLVGLLDRASMAESLPWLIVLAVLWWVAALCFILIYPRASRLWIARPGRLAVAGLLCLLPGWAALVALHAQGAQGPQYVLFLLLLIWGADVGAYFAGHRFGRSKLAPAVSPGKTWAGVWGAMATTAIVTLGGTYLLGLSMHVLLWLLPLTLFTVAVSIVGDLTESMFKRLADVKDSGGLLPGHGGILDRIDSLTAAAPMFMLGYLLWQGFA